MKYVQTTGESSTCIRIKPTKTNADPCSLGSGDGSRSTTFDYKKPGIHLVNLCAIKQDFVASCYNMYVSVLVQWRHL